MTEICECGHPEYNHTGISHTGNGFCMWAYCSCKKFKHQNHSSQDVKIGTAKTGLPEDKKPEFKGISSPRSSGSDSLKIDKKTQGKQNRAAGARFELKVRKDLEDNDWVVSKWMNNVRLDKDYCGLIPAKHKFRGVGIPMAIGTGFSDFAGNCRCRINFKQPDETD